MQNDDEIGWGVKKIGSWIDRNPRQTYHLLQTGKIPAKKVGKLWVARRGDARAAVLPDETQAA